MRMARAFIASIPVALVVVAALVVPLAVIPGTFGFQSWPSSRGVPVTERQVRLTPLPAIAVVRVRPHSAPGSTRTLASVAAPPKALAPPHAPSAPHVRVVQPPVVRHPSGNSAPAEPSPQPAPHTPQQPQQQQPQQQPTPDPQPTPGAVASGDVPVLRDNPAPTPSTPAVPPPPSPVTQVVEAIAPTPVPAAPATPAEHCHGDNGQVQSGHHGYD
jgi:hypothetical protein